jgi:hypothetical protein
MSTPQDWEDKIAKLLHKAEAGGTSPEEAQALSDAAARLMIKHGFDQAMIDAKRMAQGNKGETIGEQYIDFTGIYKQGLVTMANEITRGLGNVTVFSSNYGRYMRLTVVGYESDVKQALTLIHSLHIQVISAMNSWWTDHKYMYDFGSSMTGFAARREFVISFGSGAKERLTLARKTAMGETEKPESTALVVRDRKVAVDEWVADKYNLRTRNSARRSGGIEARQAGHAAGLQSNTGGTQVGGNRKAVGR